MKTWERAGLVFKSGLTPTQRLVVLALADFLSRDDHAICWPSAETLAGMTGFSERTVRRAIDAGEQAEWLLVERKAGCTPSLMIDWQAIGATATPDTESEVPRTQSPRSGGEDPGHRVRGGRTQSPGGSDTESDEVAHEVAHEQDQGTPPTPQGGAEQLALLGGPESEPNSGKAVPRWVTKAAAGRADRPQLFKAVLQVLQAIKGAPPDPERCKADGKLALRHWRATRDDYRHDPEPWAADVQLVARWAQESPDPGAAREIRAEGWEGGTDRSRRVGNITRMSPPQGSGGMTWEGRLEAAQAWEAAGCPGTEPQGHDASRPWLEPSATDQWPVRSKVQAQDYVEVYARDLDDIQARIREAGGGWAELAAWLEARVSDPELVLGVIRERRVA